MSKRTTVLVFFIGLKFLLQFILLNPVYDLQRDEYLHLDLGQHLAWGYLSVPPVTSWISRIIYLLGNSVFWIKFFPALFGALTILVVWKIIEELKGNLFALILGATAILFSALLRLNTLYQPNSLDVLCWTSLYFIIIKYFNTEKTKWLFIAAIIFGLGFLNKYNIIFLIAGLVPALLLTPQRKVFFKKELYFSTLLAFLLILPNLIWQYNNNFPVVHHLKELTETQLVHVERMGFLRSQLTFFIGSILVIFSGLYALLFYQPFQKYRSFFWAFFFTLAIFMYLRAKDYYAIGLYPVLIAFGSVFLEKILKGKGWKYIKPIAIALPVIFFIPLYQFAFPNKTPEYMVEHIETYKKLGQLRWEDGKEHLIPQDYADMIGWKELAKKVDSQYSTLSNKTQILVLCDNYGQAGAINYYTKFPIKAVSFNADYINWFNMNQKYIHLIRVKDFKDNDQELTQTSPYFHRSYLADSITNKFSREYKTKIFVFRDAKIDINQPIEMEIEEARKHW